MIVLLCILAFFRYRAMIPFMFALLLLEHLSRKLILTLRPMATAGAAPGTIINIVLPILMIIGLTLSLWRENPAA